jgi:hypothetical protein
MCTAGPTPLKSCSHSQLPRVRQWRLHHVWNPEGGDATAIILRVHNMTEQQRKGTTPLPTHGFRAGRSLLKKLPPCPEVGLGHERRLCWLAAQDFVQSGMQYDLMVSLYTSVSAPPQCLRAQLTLEHPLCVPDLGMRKMQINFILADMNKRRSCDNALDGWLVMTKHAQIAHVSGSIARCSGAFRPTTMCRHNSCAVHGCILHTSKRHCCGGGECAANLMSRCVASG